MGDENVGEAIWDPVFSSNMFLNELCVTESLDYRAYVWCIVLLQKQHNLTVLTDVAGLSDSVGELHNGNLISVYDE